MRTSGKKIQSPGRTIERSVSNIPHLGD